MTNIHIVTDSTALFVNPHIIGQYPITVVPNTITIAGKQYKEGIDLSTEEAMRLIRQEGQRATISSPSEAEFAALYQSLAASYESIVSIHPSRKLFSSWDNAQAAARQSVGHCEIVVIDSESLSAAQGMLVRIAARASAEEASMEDVIRIVRGTIERVYAMFYVDSINTLLPQHKIMSPSHTILGAMLGVKPCLAMENGLLRPIEKVRSRTQAIDRLIEFVVEFTDIDEMVILQNKTFPTDQTQILQDRLLLEFPGQHFPYAQYGPSLAALIGPEVIGIVLMESEMEYLGDGYTKDTFRD